jgi:hypothetical protein
VLQRLDSLSGGTLMRRTFLITGASGGMLGATYYRELYRHKQHGRAIDINAKRYVEDIAKDLLNPVLASFVARDLTSPAQKFSVAPYKYVKDRAYAFEQKLGENTRGYLDVQLKDIKEDEKNAVMPLAIFHSVVTRDGRKMLISAQPLSFLMQPLHDSSRVGTMDPDAIDFCALFAKQDPMNLRLLTALRMNATFPYVLPNVWLPSRPVIDVMDAGLRDNYGQETTLRFVAAFKDWLRENTAGVVILQVRDRKSGGWENPYESDNITELVTKPMLLLQNNWHKMQDYVQNDQLSYAENFMDNTLYKIPLQYVPASEEKGAALNFHLTNRERRDVMESLEMPQNRASLERFAALLR